MNFECDNSDHHEQEIFVEQLHKHDKTEPAIHMNFNLLNLQDKALSDRFKSALSSSSEETELHPKKHRSQSHNSSLSPRSKPIKKSRNKSTSSKKS